MYGEEERAQGLGLAGKSLLEHRKPFIRPTVKDFERWLNAVAPALLASEKLTTAIRYYQSHRNSPFRFIDEPQVPMENSPTEREFQNAAKLRLNMLFASSAEGEHRTRVLLAIAATCSVIGIPVLTYLPWDFERLGTHLDHLGIELHEIAPVEYKQSLPR